MKLTNLTKRDIFTPDAKLTFLVGAGCSVDAPSCLPAGPSMMEAIINYTCAESEIEIIKELKNLRFEQLVEILRDTLDPDLKIIDYYGQCDKPNLQHFFLADMINRGHFVMTTNFDFLIECALQKSGVPKNAIIPVITKQDFEDFSDPRSLFKKGKKAVYKIHGSTKNIITEEITKDSLVATIQALGSGKEGENVFQVEPFKRPLFDNISNNRTLVVMGYSGSDDFDIVPTLRVLEHIQDIIWINYVRDDGGEEPIYEIEMEDISNNGNLTKIDQILVDIKQINYAERVLRVDVNTTRMVKELIPTHIEISSDKFSIDAYNWLENNLDLPSRFMKYYIPYKIYYDFDVYDDAMVCSEKILQLAKKLKNTSWESVGLNNLGLIYQDQGNYPKALRRYEEALQIFGQLGNLWEKATILNNLGLIYHEQGNHPEALKRYGEALQIDEQLGNLSGKATNLNNIAGIYFAKGNYPETLKRLEAALQIFEQLGDLMGEAALLNNIGFIYQEQRNYTKALKCLETALQILRQLGLGESRKAKNVKDSIKALKKKKKRSS